jgi:hypothetical protein
MKTFETPMTLSIRLRLIGLFPQSSSYTKAIIMNDLRKKIGIDQEDISRFRFRAEEGEKGAVNYRWKSGIDTTRKFKLTKLEHELIKEILIKAGDEERLPTDPEFLAFYERTAKPPKPQSTVEAETS